MSSISVNTGSGSPTSITGLASGFDTHAIIQALIAAEKVPITHLTTQQEKLQAAQEQLRTAQSSLLQLSFSAAEFELPSLFETSQPVTASEPQRVAAVANPGAGVAATRPKSNSSQTPPSARSPSKAPRPKTRSR